MDRWNASFLLEWPILQGICYFWGGYSLNFQINERIFYLRKMIPYGSKYLLRRYFTPQIVP